MQEKKYALLDTDFLSKSYRSRSTPRDTLINRILELPDYEFFCHDIIIGELEQYTSPHTSCIADYIKWSIDTGKIICYSDERILNELSAIYGTNAYKIYPRVSRNSGPFQGRDTLRVLRYTFNSLETAVMFFSKTILKTHMAY